MKFNAFIIFNLLNYFLLIKYVDSHVFDPVKDFKAPSNRKCSHEKKNHEKNYLRGKYDRKLATTYYNDIQFQNMRMHFDYTYTLPHEEAILKELVMPQVKKFYENTLSIRRFPGKIRFPNSVNNCQGIPVPKQLQKEGVDSDLVIIVSTYRGMKKYFYEDEMKGNKKSKPSKYDTMNYNFNDYLVKYFSKNNAKNSSQYSKFFKTNQTNNNTASWEVNDSPGDVVGWSFMCLQDTYTLRPVAGVMQYVADINPSPRDIEEAIWTTLHEIMHILAMDFDLYADFIDSNFNRMEFDKTIKMKTKFIGLDKILEERKDVLNDIYAFANFNSTDFINNTNNLYNKSNTNSNKNSTTNFDHSSTNNGENNQNLDSNKTKTNTRLSVNGNYMKKYMEEIPSFLEKRGLKKLFIKTAESETMIFNKMKSENTYYKTIDSYGLSNVSRSHINKNSPINNIKSNLNSKDKHTPLENRLMSNNNSTNSTSPDEFEEILINTLFGRKYPVINLPVGDQYYEIQVPKDINLTVLTLYITNFLDHTKLYIKTQKVVEYGKKHFGCPTLDGVELEHFGGLGSSFSHWSKRILNTEFMIADSYGENYISNFTLALLEDSGWYKVDYSKSESVLWGKNRGCEFLNEKCIIKKKKKNSFFSLSLTSSSTDEKSNSLSNLIIQSEVYDTNYKDEFCTSYEEEKCSITHIFRGICAVNKYNTSIANEYQYFDNPNIAGYINFGDYCPYPIEWIDTATISPIGSCRNGIKLRSDIGEKVCENCRCFYSSLVEEKFYKKNSEKFNSTHLSAKFKHLDDTRAACYEAKCKSDKKGRVDLIIIIDDNEIKCPRGGALLTVDGFKGFIECPKVETVCVGSLDPKANYISTSAYNLFSHLPEQLLNILYDFIK
jgi:hypothetical protein